MKRYRAWFSEPNAAPPTTVEVSASSVRVAVGRAVAKFDREATKNGMRHSDTVAKHGSLMLTITCIED